MKYKTYRRAVKFRKFRSGFPKFRNEFPKLVKLILLLTAVWLAFFQGTPWPSTGYELPPVPVVPKVDSSEITSVSPFVYFLIFFVGLYLFHRLLDWWGYRRGNFLEEVKMID